MKNRSHFSFTYRAMFSLNSTFLTVCFFLPSSSFSNILSHLKRSTYLQFCWFSSASPTATCMESNSHFYCKERREIARYCLFSGSVWNSFGASWTWVFELWSLWLNSFANLVFHRLFPLQHNCDSFSLQLAQEQSSLIAGQRDSASGRYRTTKRVPNRLPWLQILPVAQRP